MACHGIVRLFWCIHCELELKLKKRKIFPNPAARNLRNISPLSLSLCEVNTVCDLRVVHVETEIFTDVPMSEIEKSKNITEISSTYLKCSTQNCKLEFLQKYYFPSELDIPFTEL